MSTVRVNVDALGYGTVTVDGQDMGDIVNETRVITHVGEATRIELSVVAQDVDAFAVADVAFRVFVAGHFGEGSTPRKAVENLLEQMPKD